MKLSLLNRTGLGCIIQINFTCHNFTAQFPGYSKLLSMLLLLCKLYLKLFIPFSAPTQGFFFGITEPTAPG